MPPLPRLPRHELPPCSAIGASTVRQALHRHGYAIVPDCLPAARLASLRDAFAAALGTRPGSRDGLEQPAVLEVLAASPTGALLRAVLGDSAFAYRATLFDKSRATNWLVAWHQDLVVPVRERGDAAGFGPWTDKRGVVYVQPPVAALERAVALRFDLDGSTADNGALRVLPGSHRLGVLSAAQISRLAAKVAPVTCCVPAGGVLLMRPLLLHSSSRAVAPGHRRVLHVECTDLPLSGADGPAYRWRVRHDAYTGRAGSSLSCDA